MVESHYVIQKTTGLVKRIIIGFECMGLANCLRSSKRSFIIKKKKKKVRFRNRHSCLDVLFTFSEYYDIERVNKR